MKGEREEKERKKEGRREKKNRGKTESSMSRFADEKQ
jgi:hypothetical protein